MNSSNSPHYSKCRSLRSSNRAATDDSGEESDAAEDADEDDGPLRDKRGGDRWGRIGLRSLNKVRPPADLLQYPFEITVEIVYKVICYGVISDLR